MFTATEWSTAKDKQDFYNHFIKFVESDFKRSKFTKKFYNRLSNCFGHIAHYNINGFYDVWFSTSQAKLDFLLNAIRFSCYGDAKFTDCDVEKELVKWLSNNTYIDKYVRLSQEQTRIAELQEYTRLKSKFEPQNA